MLCTHNTTTLPITSKFQHLMKRNNWNMCRVHFKSMLTSKVYSVSPFMVIGKEVKLWWW
jgi:hypothetical protein